MSHIKVARGGIADIKFKLYQYAGGPLTDPDGWVAGTGSTWPSVVFKRASDNVDVTATFVRNIASDTLPTGAIKHPTTSTGIWRESTAGSYAERIEPQSSLALGDYYMTVTYTINGAVTQETHTIALVAPGDVAFGDQVLAVVTATDVKRGITTTLDDPTITGLITEATEYVEGRLDQVGIDADTLTEIPLLIKSAIIWFSRYLVFGMDASAFRKTSMLQEGDVRITFSGNSQKDADALLGLSENAIDRYIGVHGRTRKVQFNVIQLGDAKRWN